MRTQNLSLQPNDDLGFYRVGGQRYESKIQACIAGTKLGEHPTWYFRDDVWNRQDWTAEPATDILELYRQRARQIREQYDYVIINYSGGSDSQTIVDAFLQAGCFIDEIQTVWQKANPVVLDPTVTRASNIEAEWHFTARHGINRILEQSPRTKITYLDVSDDVVNVLDKSQDESWVEDIAEKTTPRHVCTWSQTWFDDQLKVLDRGQRTAVLFGVDKPRICIKDNKFHVYFVDSVINQFRVSTSAEYDNIDYVYFYWTAQMPEIVIKQAHLVKHWFEANPRLRPILNWPNNNMSYRRTYESLVRTIIYPEWDMNTWQAEKNNFNVFNEWVEWFTDDMRDSRAYHHWIRGLEYVQTHVDKKYLTYARGRFDGFVGFINGHFCIEKP